jgi:hypothetical protein
MERRLLVNKRQIRVRAWDPIRREFFTKTEDPERYIEVLDGVLTAEAMSSEANPQKVELCPIQLSTGVYDMQNEEIFEGDILGKPYWEPVGVVK